MVRIGAIFIALCMVLIATSLGAVLFLRFGFSAVDSALAARIPNLEKVKIRGCLAMRPRAAIEADPTVLLPLRVITGLLKNEFADSTKIVAEALELRSLSRIEVLPSTRPPISRPPAETGAAIRAIRQSG